MLTFPAGSVSVIEGTLSAGSSASRLRVYGKLIVEEHAVINRGNIRVEAGGELVIRAGAQIRFDGGTGLYASGEVRAEGSSASPIAFSSRSGAPYSYLYFHGSGAGGSLLKHVRIEGSTYGLHTNDAFLTLENVEGSGNA